MTDEKPDTVPAPEEPDLTDLPDDVPDGNPDDGDPDAPLKED